MTPLVFGLGVWELLIILAVILLISAPGWPASARALDALREFKEETRGLSDSKEAQASDPRLPQSSGPSRERRGREHLSPPPSASLPNSGPQDPPAGEPRADT